MLNFTPNTMGAQSATGGTSIAYSRTFGSPAIEQEPGWHIAAPGPHAQHHVTVAIPRFEPEPLEPALPVEWIAVVPVAMIVAAHMTARRASRYIRAPRAVS